MCNVSVVCACTGRGVKVFWLKTSEERRKVIIFIESWERRSFECIDPKSFSFQQVFQSVTSSHRGRDYFQGHDFQGVGTWVSCLLVVFRHGVSWILSSDGIFMFCKSVTHPPLCPTDVKAATLALEPINNKCCVTVGETPAVKSLSTGHIYEGVSFINIVTVVA